MNAKDSLTKEASQITNETFSKGMNFSLYKFPKK